MTQKTKHIALWGAWYGSRNVGDQALLLTIADLLGAEVGSVRFTVFTANPEHVLNYTQVESRWKFEVLHNIYQFPQVLKTVAACDLFVLGGGAPFYEEKDHLFAIATLFGLARLARTPYMTWTVSSQIVQDRIAMRLFGWVLNGAAAITYRDEHTRRLFERCGVTKEIHLAADPVFCLEPAGAESGLELISRAGLREPERPLVALTPRTFRGRDGDAQTHYNVKSQEEFDQKVACFSAALDWLYDQGYQPLLLPMNTVSPDDDRIAARRIIQESRHGSHALLVDEEVRPRIAPAVYAQCAASFVARVHGSVTSMIAGCPVMMYAFAPKHAGIMQAMGLSDFILDEASASPERTIEMLSGLLSRRREVHQFMAKRLVELQQSALVPSRLAGEILLG